MSQNLRNHAGHMMVLANKDKKLRNAVLKFSNKKFIFAICELVDNLLAGNIPISQKQKKNLSKYKCLCRKIANKSIDVNKKRRLLVQNGGFLGELIPLAISVVPEIINGIKSLFNSQE